MKIARLYKRATVLLACFTSQAFGPPNDQFDGVDVHLTLQLPAGVIALSSNRVYNLRIPGLGDDLQCRGEDEQCIKMLDALIATGPAQVSDSNPIYNLTTYKARYLYLLSSGENSNECNV